ncbi:MAG: hypothetical protein ACLTSX_12845 [Collinsella sp.]
MGEYLADNYEECQRRYADAGISAVFTGHMHANDIASIKTDAGNVLLRHRDLRDCHLSEATSASLPLSAGAPGRYWRRVNATLAVGTTRAGRGRLSGFCHERVAGHRGHHRLRRRASAHGRRGEDDDRRCAGLPDDRRDGRERRREARARRPHAAASASRGRDGRCSSSASLFGLLCTALPFQPKDAANHDCELTAT